MSAGRKVTSAGTGKPGFLSWAGTGATTKGGGPSGALEGYVNLPLWGESAGLRLSAYDEVEGGYLDDIVQHRSNVDRTERRGGRLTLLAQRPWLLKRRCDQRKAS